MMSDLAPILDADLDYELFGDSSSRASETTIAGVNMKTSTKPVHAGQGSSSSTSAAATPAPTKPVASASQLNAEAQKQEKLRRREMALKAKMSKEDSKVMDALAAVGAKKRKRGELDEGEGKEVKKGLTDVAAAKIAEQIEHPAVKDLGDVEKRRDSVVDGGFEGGVAAEVAEKEREPAVEKKESTQKRKRGDEDEIKEKRSKRECIGDGVTEKAPADESPTEQHLAPPPIATTSSRASTGLEILEDDDEMTRMLKEEFLKEEAIMKPLTEDEKFKLAIELDKRVKKGCAPPSEKSLRKAVEMLLNAREKKSAKAKAPKKTSPLAREVVYATPETGPGSEEQEIEGRKKLAPKSRKPASAAVAEPVPVSATGSLTTGTDTNAGDDTSTFTELNKTANPLLRASASPPPRATLTYNDMTNPELKALLRSRSLKLTGKKADFMRRLEAYDREVGAGEVPKGRKLPGSKQRYERMN